MLLLLLFKSRLMEGSTMKSPLISKPYFLSIIGAILMKSAAAAPDASAI